MSTLKRIIAATSDAPVNEETIARAWLSGGWSQLKPVDSVIKVIYPGRRKRTNGPDFVDAIVNIDGRRLAGAVEIHVNASDWRTHHHHLNPAYNSTILHVVMKSDSALPPVTAEGKTVTQVRLSLTALNTLIHSELTFFPCRSHDISNSVRDAGIARFKLKTQRFLADMRFQPPDEALYRGISTALGYQENQTPMRSLAEVITLADIKDGGCDRRLPHLEALILWNAGLLTELSAKVDVEARRLWQILPGRTNAPTLSRGHWHFARVRPVNSPARRLAALACLIHRHRASQLYTGLLEPLRQEKPGVKAVQLLEEKLVIAGHGYWACHWDFARPLPRTYALLGAERASTIATNAILPFACALGQITDDTRLTSAAIDIYHTYPARCGNEIARYMSHLLSFPAKTVCEEQGLIHIYHTWCREKQCESCPASSA
ncbi:MAG: DUF2851 family protein [Chloroflexota bacterium]